MIESTTDFNNRIFKRRPRSKTEYIRRPSLLRKELPPLPSSYLQKRGLNQTSNLPEDNGAAVPIAPSPVPSPPPPARPSFSFFAANPNGENHGIAGAFNQSLAEAASPIMPHTIPPKPSRTSPKTSPNSAVVANDVGELEHHQAAGGCVTPTSSHNEALKVQSAADCDEKATIGVPNAPPLAPLQVPPPAPPLQATLLHAIPMVNCNIGGDTIGSASVTPAPPLPTTGSSSIPRPSSPTLNPASSGARGDLLASIRAGGGGRRRLRSVPNLPSSGAARRLSSRDSLLVQIQQGVSLKKKSEEELATIRKGRGGVSNEQENRSSDSDQNSGLSVALYKSLKAYRKFVQVDEDSDSGSDDEDDWDV